MSFVLYPHIRDYTGLGAARVIAVAYSLTFAGLSLTHAQGRAFQFGLVGDTGYSTEEFRASRTWSRPHSMWRRPCAG